MANPIDIPQNFSTTLNVPGGINNSQTTGIILTSVSGLPTDGGMLGFDWANPIDTSTMEYIEYTGISGNELTGVTRGQEGYSAKSHSNNATIVGIVSRAHIKRVRDKLTGNDATLAQDPNGNEIIKTSYVASAVNEITTTNAATGNDPSITATGGDTNISFKIKAKGSGKVKIGSAELQFPNADGTAGQIMKTDGSGVLSFITPSSASPITRSIWMRAQDFTAAEGSPTLSAGSNADTPACWLLDDAAAAETVTGEVTIPKDYSSGNITLKIYFAMVSATSGNVQIDTRMLSIANNADALANGTSSSDTISVPGTAGLLKIATRGATFATGGVDEMLRVSIRRLGSNGSDTATGDMRFFGCSLEYTAIL